jgi:hypothetical protein
VKQRPAIFLISVFLSACGMPDTGPPPDKVAMPRMTLVRVRDVSPGVDPKAWEGQSVTIYRLGQQYGRVEFANGDVVLVREPHTFFIDMSVKKAYHGIDPGPTYVFRTPVVRRDELPSEFPPELMALEFGTEPEFLAHHGATERMSSVQDGVEVREQHVAFGDYSLIISSRQDNGAPLQLGIFHEGKLEIAFQYEEWRRDLLPTAVLFGIPEGIEIVDGAPPGAEEEEATEEATPGAAEDAPAPEEEAPPAAD